jgi:glutathione S-transferase
MTLRLITIPISHYCEKARWALERAGLVYQEEAHVQLVHYVATLRAGGGVTAPVLVHDDGVLADSSDILRWVDDKLSNKLYPDAHASEVRDLERAFDDRLGVSGRLWMYDELLGHVELAGRYNCAGVPNGQRRAFPHLVPFVGRFIKWRLGIDDEAAILARREYIAIFDEVGERLADGRQFLVGDSFTAADLTFAALSAPLVLPERYGVPLPSVGELPPSYAMHVSALREHPAGEFALRMYATER